MKHRSQSSLVCPNGHEVPVPSHDGLGEFVACPECRARVAVDSHEPERSRPAGKGLWQLMGQVAQAPTSDFRSEISDFESPIKVGGDTLDAELPLPESPAPNSLREPTSEATDKPAALGFKALWQRARASELPDSPPTGDFAGELVAAPSPPVESPKEKPRGLWAVMGAPDHESAATNRTDPTKAAPTTLSPNADLLDDDDEPDGDEIEDSEDAIAGPISSPAPVPLVTAAAERKVRQVGRRALTLGVIGILLAPLNLTPFFALKVPAVVCGLMAMIWGHQTWDEGRRSSERNKLAKLSIAAMACGLIGILAGPAGLNSLGKHWRQGVLQEGAAANLEAIGRGIDEFHAQYGYYPNGDTVGGSKGEGLGQQSWLTELLPFLGRTELLRQMDLRQPYNHPANRFVMRQPVSAFLVPGVPHTPNNQGLATAHFSGVGGQRSDQFGQVNLGIFGHNATVTRSDVTDGLSQTLIVGEVVQRLPAWGDPENWRSIETGLNKHAYGFGNAPNTGSHFLMADGSVRFFPNSTELGVLEKLSSRDGADPVALDAE